jgi:two-component system, cell cycle sensor histidine kinase and response regulator CckA
MNYEGQLPGKYQHHLLCVDDEEPRLLLTARILESNGYRVTACANPLKATQIFEQENIELAVTDYHMPGMNGARLAAHLKNRCPEVKVVLFTGALQVPQPDPLLLDAVVPKSYGAETLLETVENLLATPANATNFTQRGMSAVRA